MEEKMLGKQVGMDVRMVCPTKNCDNWTQPDGKYRNGAGNVGEGGKAFIFFTKQECICMECGATMVRKITKTTVTETEVKDEYKSGENA